jgi:hypothetical protein
MLMVSVAAFVIAGLLFLVAVDGLFRRGSGPPPMSSSGISSSPQPTVRPVIALGVVWGIAGFMLIVQLLTRGQS